MRKAPPQDSQHPDQRDYLPSPFISVLTLKVLSVLTAILGTACTLALASQPQQAPRLATSNQISVQLLKDSPLLAFGNGLTARRHYANTSWDFELPIFDRRSLTESRRDASVLQSGKERRPPTWGIGPRACFQTALSDLDPPQPPFLRGDNQVLVPFIKGDLGESSSLKTCPRALVRVPMPTKSPVLQWGEELNKLAPQTTPSPQSPVDLGTSSKLDLFSAVDWEPGQPLQNKQNHVVAEVISQAQLPQGQPAEQGVETKLQQNQQESPQKGQEVKLTLSDIVVLALQNNRPLKNAYLERIAERQDLAVAEGKFIPNFTPTVSVSIAQFGLDRITTNGGLGAGATISVTVPTGGELSFSWAVNGQTPNPNGFSIDTNGDIFEPNLQLSFRQPLLRGAGINLNRASIDIARLTEQVNILNLKSTLIDTITNAIFAYRNLLQAQEQLKIEQQSLELAQQILEVNRALIEAGRVAPVDIVQSQTAVANRQVSLLTAQNNLEATKLALIDLLDIEQTINIVAAETPIAKPTPLDSNKLRQLAFNNRPDYLRAQLNQKTSQLLLLLAEDDKRWDLNLITSLNNTLNSTSDVRAGLVLSREFGDLTKQQRFVRSQVNLLQAENTLNDLNDSIQIQVTDRVRDVNLRFSQVERARQATVLSERQLNIEREKQRLGRGAGIFEIVRLQNDLVSARNAELEATMEYLNALTRLDQTLGTTLDTWQVTLDRQ
ncbi:MAG TPA: TolC family protein [Oculatellaceae cyanobacterium]